MNELYGGEFASLISAAPFLKRYADEQGFFEGVPLTLDLEQIVSDSTWHHVREAIVECILDEGAPPLRRLLPGLLHVPDDFVENVPLRVRTRNVLTRAGITRWSALAERRPMDILIWRNTGLTTAKDLLSVCVDLGFAALTPSRYPFGDLGQFRGHDSAKEHSETSEPGSDSEMGRGPGSLVLDDRTASLLQYISVWAIEEKSLVKLGQVIPLGSLNVGPPDVVQTFESLADLELASLVSQTQRSEAPGDLAVQLLDALDPSKSLVYRRRLLDEDRPTLEIVGRELGVTRERVRQLQLIAESEVEKALAGHEFRMLRWRAWELQNALGVEAPISHPEYLSAMDTALRGSNNEVEQVLRPLLLHVAGPYFEKGGWLFNKSLPRVDPKELATIADSSGTIPFAEAEAWLSARGVRVPFQEDWIIRTKRFRRSNDRLMVWTGGAIDKCVTLLASEGRPMDAEDLVDQIGEGHNARGIRARLFEDPRLMRVNRTLWALRAWDMEEYSGIAEEIAQRIHEWGGRARLSDLVSELVPLFGVRETSVRVYAQAPMFVIEDGWVRMRTLDEEPFMPTTELSRCKGIFRTSSGVNALFLVDAEVLRGSGRLFPDAAAALLGVSPGNRRTFEHETGSIVISWPTTAGLGPTIGSTRKFADAVGAVEGDLMRIAFSSELGSANVARIVRAEVANSDPVEALSLVCGIQRDTSVDQALAFAVGVAPTAVRRTLKERGDDLVAELIPEDQLDEGLEAALEDFAKLLDGRL